MTTTSTFNGRDLAIRAVVAGAAELQLGAEPDLFLGRRCYDQSIAHRLVRAGVVAAAATLGSVGQHIAALTPRRPRGVRCSDPPRRAARDVQRPLERNIVCVPHQPFALPGSCPLFT